ASGHFVISKSRTLFRTCPTAFSAWSANINVSSLILSGDFFATALRMDASGYCPSFGINRTKNCIRTHDDLISGKGDKGAAGHCVMRNEGRDSPFMLVNRTCNLQRGQNQSSGSVQHNVDWNPFVREMNRPQHFLRVVYIDIA